jgi:hypothetical protein
LFERKDRGSLAKKIKRKGSYPKGRTLAKQKGSLAKKIKREGS